MLLKPVLCQNLIVPEVDKTAARERTAGKIRIATAARLKEQVYAALRSEGSSVGFKRAINIDIVVTTVAGPHLNTRGNREGCSR
jgi:hypothetical protein